jgi:hypothetical protein
MSGQLIYRLARDEDLPGLLRLWEEESGWGALTADQWRRWYVETPHGPCIVTVAEDTEGEVVGQEVFTPSRLHVDGLEVPALRLSAPILRKDLRRESLRKVDHPVIGLFMAGKEAAVAGGYGVIYALPEHAWLPFFRWCPRWGLPRFADAELGCVATPVVPFPRGQVSNLVAGPIGPLGPEYEALWETARDAFHLRCAVVRSPEWIGYKNGGHISLEVRDPADGALAGYVAIARRTNLLVDMLARRPVDLGPVLAAAVRWLAARPADERPDQIKAMETPVLSPALRELGFTPIDYTFALVCHALDPRLPAEDDLLGRWYAMPGD